MTVRDSTQIPPFKFEGKRVIVKSLDPRGREQLGFGDAQDVWVNYVLVPLASGLTDSVKMRFVGGQFWYRVRMDRNKAFDLLKAEPNTDELVGMINSRYSLDASPAPRSRLHCQYRGASGRRCQWEAEPDWTTCKAHYDKGGPRVTETDEDPVVEHVAYEPMELEDSEDELSEENTIYEDDADKIAYQELLDHRDYLQQRVWELERKLALAQKGDSEQ